MIKTFDAGLEVQRSAFDAELKHEMQATLGGMHGKIVQMNQELITLRTSTTALDALTSAKDASLRAERG